MPSGPILMGVVGRPHGVRGLLHVRSYTADPADLAGYGPLTDERGRVWTLAWRGEGVAELRDASGRAVADRTEAEALVNLRLSVPRERLPAPAEDEFYLADLIGLAAVDEAGATQGSVGLVHDYGGGVSLEIVRDGGVSLMLPFTRAAVPEIDLVNRRLVIVPPTDVEPAPAVSP